jgi:hypothetical protein
MRKTPPALVALFVLAVPLVATAQPPPPPPAPPSIVGQWALSLKVTKGNKQDEARIGQGGTMACVLSGQDVICQTATVSDDGRSLSSVVDGKFDGTTLALDGKWPCSWDCVTDIHFTGSLVKPGMLEGQWTALLYVGFGHYEVGGTWKAIKINP